MMNTDRNDASKGMALACLRLLARSASFAICAAMATMISVFHTSPAAAQTNDLPSSILGAPRFDPKSVQGDLSIKEAQSFLIWTGYYYGEIDGKRSEDTVAAIKSFQLSMGDSATGRLTRSQERELRKRAIRAEDTADVRLVKDEWTGISVKLPLGFLDEPFVRPEPDEATSNSTVFYLPKGSSSLKVILRRIEVPVRGNQMREVFDLLLEEKSKDKENSILSSDVDGDLIIFQWLNDGDYNLELLRRGPEELRGLIVSYPISSANVFLPVRSLILTSLDPFDGAGLSQAERRRRIVDRRYPGFVKLPDWRETVSATGSGSVVSYQGHVLTNYHVVQGCRRLTVNGNDAALIGVDIVNDLAVVRAPHYEGRESVQFRAEGADLGEEILVVGYPQFGKSKTLNVTNGIVSARMGWFDNRSNIQITAPVQGGNSGGPVLDRDGRQLAVVVSKIAAQSVENIAFVIRGEVAIDFLKSFDIPIRTTRGHARADQTIREVVAEARRFTVRVECHRGG